MTDYGNRMVTAETLVAQSYPVYDFRLRSDPANPFRLYDCLKPVRRENLMIPVQFLPKTHGENVKLHIDLKHAEEDLAKLEVEEKRI